MLSTCLEILDFEHFQLSSGFEIAVFTLCNSLQDNGQDETQFYSFTL